MCALPEAIDKYLYYVINIAEVLSNKVRTQNNSANSETQITNMNTFFSFLKRFSAFFGLLITLMMAVSCTVVEPPQQGRGQMMPQGGPYGPQQGYYPQQPYPGQMTPQQWQQLHMLQQMAAVQQVPGGNVGQPQHPHGRLNVIPGTGRQFDAKVNGVTGVVTWELNGAPVRAASVPPAAKQGLEESLRAQGYSGPRIKHQE